MRRRTIVLVGVLTVLPASGLHAQGIRDTAADRVHRLVLAEDYEAAIAAGNELARRGTASPEARAWTIAALASYGRRDEARVAARSLKRGHPGSRWADYALFVADDGQAARMIRRVRAAAPWDPVFVAAYARALPRSAAGRPNPRAALALLDSAVARSGPSAELWQARASAEMAGVYASMTPDTAAAARALAACDQALRLDSARAGAWSMKARLHLLLGSPGRALATAERAVAVLPTSLGAHRVLWDVIARRADLTPEERGKQIGADVEALSAARGRTPGLLLAAGRAYQTLELAAPRAALEAELSRDHAGSWEVEQLDLDDIGRLDERASGRNADSTAARAELLRRANAFTAQSGHTPLALGRVYDLQLWHLARDTTAPLPDLARATEGAMRYGQATGAATALLRLAEHAETRPLARRLAARLAEVMAAGRGRLVSDTTEALRRQRQLESQRREQAIVHDLVGWIAFHEGRYAAAARELARARKLSPDVGTARYHLGRLEERRGRLRQAVTEYAAAFWEDRYLPGHPVEAALKRVFARQDSAAGAFDRFVSRRGQAERARQEARKEKVRRSILAERLANPKPLPALNLTRLEGGSFSTADLRGKIAVVNFWGTWCAPCVQELPTIQQLYERYRNDPDVVVVTIDDERGAPDPRRLVTDLMTARKLTFPVLLADSTVSPLVLAWPTTWYVDREGRIAYEQRGATYATADLTEPFVWRIESLRDTTGTPAKAAPAAQPRTPHPPTPRAERTVSSSQARDAAAAIRHLYLASLYEQAIAAEETMEKSGQATPQARAWAVAAMAEYGRVDDALAAAHALVRELPADPWAHFARALALAEAGDTGAVASAARARAADPWAPDFVWLRAKVLLGRGRYDKPAAAALLDSAWSRLKPDAPLYLARAEALNIYVPGPRPAIDTARLRHQEALVDSALSLEPAYYDAWSWQANQSAMRGRPGAAAEAMRRAVLAAPASPAAHADYWQRLRQIHFGMIPPDTLDPDVARLLEASQRSAGALLVSSQIYAGALRHDRAAALEAELRRRFPGSYEVERADLRRIEELYVGLMVQQAGEASADRTELRRRARAFTSRSHALGDVYSKWLDVVVRERSVPDAEVAEVAGKALSHGKPDAASVRAAALRLAEHPASRTLATRLAQAYPALARGQRVLHTSDPDTAAARRRLEQEDAGIVRDVLGWSAFHAGRSQSAEAEIKRAVKLAPGDPIIHYHMGRLAERRGDLAAAEAAFTAGLARESPGGDRPNLPALRGLLARPGVRASIREHAAATLAANTEARKAAVLATRISRPKSLPRFDLERFTGGRFSSDSLRGRVAFVNFWGVWCAPCVRELPDIQKLYDRYRNDPAVVLITIDNDPDANMVREFLKVRKLDFPVLRADSVVQQMNIGYPTTWIVDRQGRIAYDDSGEPPQDRAQEWAWRIESLKGKGSP